MKPPRYLPMLASGGAIPGHASDYAFEPKFDGWRAIATVHEGHLTVRTRRGNDITESLAELAPMADRLGRSAVLDAELVAGNGAPESFYRVGGRVASRRATSRSRAAPLSLVVFDVLWLDGEDLTRTSYRDRRVVLEELQLQGPSWCTTPSYEGAGAELFAACTSLGLEGLVAKRLDGLYFPGERKPVWIKAKCAGWRQRHGQFRGRHGAPLA